MSAPALPRRGVLAGAFLTAAALPAAAGGDEACGVGHRCRLRPPGPPQPTGVDPPRTLSPEAAPRFGGGRLVELYGDATSPWSRGDG